MSPHSGGGATEWEGLPCRNPSKAGKRRCSHCPPARGGQDRLKEPRGNSHVVLYFYPKDMTSGCTQEARSFRDLRGEFEAVGAAILGVSPDDLDSHDRFVAKNDLSFPLLSDAGAKVCRKCGVWQEKSMYGREYMGVERTTVFIDKAGTVRKVYPKVKVKNHADEVLACVKELE